MTVARFSPFVLSMALGGLLVGCPASDGGMRDGGTSSTQCDADTDCNDHVSCTNDSCGATGVCVFTLAPALCPVGSSCDPRDGCVAGAPCGTDAECTDSNPCTTNEMCNPVSRTCVFTPLDGDSDGQPPAVCGGTDCDDSRADIFVGAEENCAPEDRNCNGLPADVSAAALVSDHNNCGVCGMNCGSGYCAGSMCRTYGATDSRCRATQYNRCDDPLDICAYDYVNAPPVCRRPDCGRPGLPCCMFGEACDHDEPVDAESPAYPSSTCVSNVCQPCGADNQPCCEDAGFPSYCWEREAGTGWRSCVANTCVTDANVDDACTPGMEQGPDDLETFHRPGQCYSPSWLEQVSQGGSWTYREILESTAVPWTCCNVATSACVSSVYFALSGGNSYFAAAESFVGVSSGGVPFGYRNFAIEANRTMVQWSATDDWYLMTIAADGLSISANVYRDGPSDTTPNESWLCQ